MKAEDVYQEFAEMIADDLRANLVAAGKGSGPLANSIDAKVEMTSAGVSIKIEALDYLTFVDAGRRKTLSKVGGKLKGLPPPQPLEAWARKKGFPQDAIFALQVKIARDGIKPTNVIQKTLSNATSRYLDKMTSKLATAQLEEVKKILESINL